MKVRCVSCKSMIAVPDKELAGKKGKVKVRCPSCNTVLGIHLKDKEKEAEWYYAVEGERQGPLTMTGLLALAEAGTIRAETLVWKPGFENWLPASSVEDLAMLVAPAGTPTDDVSATSPGLEQTVAGEAASDEPAQEPPAEEPAFQQEAAPAEEAPSPESLFPQDEAPAPAEKAPSPESLFPQDEDPAPAFELPAEEPAFQQEEAAADEHQVEDMLFRQEAPAEEAPAPAEEAPAPAFELSAEEPAFQQEEAAADEHQVEDMLFPQEAPADEPMFPQEEPAYAQPRQPAATERFVKPIEEEALFPIEEEEEPRSDRYAPEPEADSGGGLFDGFDGGDEPAQSSSSDRDGMLHSRRETSVLFSLDDLVQKDKGRKERKTDKHPVVDDSGLIDIRQVAMEQQSDDLFAGFGSKESADVAPSVVTQIGLQMPILKKRSKWPLALAAGFGGIVLAAAAAYGVMMLTGAPGQEVIQQSIAMASEQALRQKSDGMLKLQEEYQARLEAARKSGQEARLVASAEAQKILAEAQVQRERTLGEVRSRQEMRISDLTNKLEAVRKDAEDRKKRVLIAANDTPPGKEEVAVNGNGGAKAVEGTGSAVAPAEAKKTVKDEKKTAKKEEKGTAKKEAAKKEAARKESFIKEEVKKEEVKKEPVEEKQPAGKDAKALLAALDKKQDGNGEGEDGAVAVGKKMLTTTEIMKVVNGNKPAMRDCFDKYGAGLESATIRTKITIAGGGNVTAVTISSMEFAGTALGNCVKKVQMGMTFPAFAKPSLSKGISVRLP